jgi:sucrose-6-phosphate hydrolase SacC (GH32 family)
LIKYNYGNAFYASQTFNNVPASDGRRIQIAWGLTDTPGMSFNQSLLFPVNLTLRSTEEGIRMSANPVEEIKNLSVNEHKWNNILVAGNEDLLSGIESKLLDIYVEFQVERPGSFGIMIKGKEIKYDTETQMISCDEEQTRLKPIDGIINLRILVDKLTFELFANDGLLYMPIRAYPEEKQSSLEIFSKKGDVIVNSLIVNELKSIWN